MPSILTLPPQTMEFDGLYGPTREDQEDTESHIAPFLDSYRPVFSDDGSNEKLLPPAKDIKNKKIDPMPHLKFLSSQLDVLPSKFVSLDASRPWIIYWCVQALALMNVTLDEKSKRRVTATLLSLQNPLTGGFGGGIGQMSHLAPTYAASMSLAIVGDVDGGTGWENVDRQKLHHWLLSLKQPDGSFVMHEGGEVDVRGVYCALCTATIFNILTPELARGVERFLISCQTYEGGLAAASQPFPNSSFLQQPGTAPPHQPSPLRQSATPTQTTTFTSSSSSPEPNPPLGECHGGYSFCALAGYFLLHDLPSLASPISHAPTKDLDLENLLRWGASLQGLPSEAGGFRGRTNKLVDGCYSQWCGGLFNILDALMGRDQGEEGEGNEDVKVESPQTAASSAKGKKKAKETTGESVWEEDHASLYDREALQIYVLLIAQVAGGGFRDKPGKSPDGYHSAYNLAGLSAAQHKMVYSNRLATAISTFFHDPFGKHEGTFPFVNGMPAGTHHVIRDEGESDEMAKKRMNQIFVRCLAWKELEEAKLVVGDPENELVVNHPIFNIPMEAAQKVMCHFYRQPLDPLKKLK